MQTGFDADIQSRIAELVEEILAANSLQTSVRPDASLADAGLTSMEMVNLMLGETLEQQRFFEHMLAGREDLLGRRLPGSSTGDGVLPVRWIS